MKLMTMAATTAFPRRTPPVRPTAPAPEPACGCRVDGPACETGRALFEGMRGEAWLEARARWDIHLRGLGA